MHAERYAIGVDIGGTSIKAGVVSKSGLLIDSLPLPTSTESIYADIDSMVRSLREKNADKEILPGVGVCSPGVIDPEKGCVIVAVNMGWKDERVVEKLTEILGQRVVLEHDLRAGASAEAAWGCKHKNFMYIAIGTGLAISIVIDGKPLAVHPWCGEIGQIYVKNKARNIENIIGAAGIENFYTSATGEQKTAQEIIHSRESIAQEIWSDAIDELAQLIAYAVGIFGSIPVIIGGGISQAGAALFIPLKEKLGSRIGILPEPSIEAAHLGADAQILGAAHPLFTTP